MTRGTITNKQTGLEIAGTLRSRIEAPTFIDFQIDGASSVNYFRGADWDFTPEPESIKGGVYTYKTGRPEDLVILKYSDGGWCDADGYRLPNQNVVVSDMVRLVPEGGE